MNKKIYASVYRKGNSNELNLTITSKFNNKNKVDHIRKLGLSFKECADFIESLQLKYLIDEVIVDEIGLSLGLKDELDFRTSKKYNASFLLDFSIKNKVLIKSKERGNGKTTAIMKKCAEKGYTMIVAYNLETYNEMAKKMGFDIEIKQFGEVFSPRGIILTNKEFLVDTLVDESIIDELISAGHVLKGGFIR